MINSNKKFFNSDKKNDDNSLPSNLTNLNNEENQQNKDKAREITDFLEDKFSEDSFLTEVRNEFESDIDNVNNNIQTDDKKTQRSDSSGNTIPLNDQNTVVTYTNPRKRIREFLKSWLSNYIRTKHIDQLVNISFKSFKMVFAGDNKDFKFNNIYQIISSPATLILAYCNISNNKGILTPGTVIEDSIDGSDLEKIEELSKKLINKQFKFTPFLRKMIPKPKKPWQTETKYRPLGIMNFEDKLVQEATKIVLSAIYEPEFTKLECNFGFRPYIGCQDALHAIKMRSRGTYYAIEGDIKGAYDNVNFEKLIEILEKKIDDKVFIEFIRNGLHCGLMLQGNFEDTLTGVPQGSILSPLLFNIYMHEFDEFMLNELEILERKKSPSKKETFLNVTTAYQDNKLQTRILKRRINKIKEDKKDITNHLSGKKKHVRITWKIEPRLKTDTNSFLRTKGYLENRLLYEINRKNKKIRFLKKQNKKLNILKSKTQHSDPSKRKAIFRYFRYADDWILLNNQGMKFNLEFRQKIEAWLKDNLHLELAIDKTKITDFTKIPVNFLGFTIFVRRGKRTKIKRKNKIFFRRVANAEIIIGIDKVRLKDRLKSKGFVKEKSIFTNKSIRKILFPVAKPSFAILKPELIIETYNSVIRGLCAYYGPVIKERSMINEISYYLAYSCMKTLAAKYKSTIFKLCFVKDSRFGCPPKISITKNHKGEDISKEYKLLYKDNFTEFFEKIKENGIDRLKNNFLAAKINPIQAISSTIKDNPFKMTIWNYRSGMLLFLDQCVICESTDGVNIHHVKHIRKMGKKTTGFLKTMAGINRKKIIVCKECHRKIHSGEYNNKRLMDFALPDHAAF